MSTRILLLLAATALTAFLGLLLGPLRAPLPRAAIFHIVLATGIMPLIMGAMLYFAPVLARSAAPHRLLSLLPLLALAGGVGGVVSLSHGYAGLALAVLPALTACLVLLGWMQRLKNRCLGGPHPGLHWYRAALFCLALGLGAVLLLPVFTAHWPVLRSFHLHINTLGFIGLSAIGTLQVLLPTAGGYPDPEAALRLRRDLPYALAGSLLTALGAAVWMPLSLAGLGLWLVALTRFLESLWPQRRVLRDVHNAPNALGAASLGFAILLLAGGAHGLGWLAPASAFPLLSMGFLFPLVSGAVSYLLPLWRWPGPHAIRQRAARQALVEGSGWRSGIFLACAWLAAAGFEWAVYPAVAMLGMFALQAVMALKGYSST